MWRSTFINKEPLLLLGRTKHKLKNSNILLELPASSDFHRLYQSSLPIGLSAQPSPAFTEGKVSSSATGDLSKYSDIVFKVEGCHFHCHKLFFAMQSDYFLALIEDHFYESRESLQGATVYELTDISLEAFDALLCYLYSNFTLVRLQGGGHNSDFSLGQCFLFSYQSTVPLNW